MRPGEPIPPVAFPPGEGPGEKPGGFEKDVEVDKPGIVGARWWHRSLMEEDRTVSRRGALKGLLVAGGVVGGIGALGYGFVKAVEQPGEPVSLETRRSLDMQKKYGWDFGARGTALVFDGRSEAPFVRAELERLAEVMQPRLNAKFHVPTLVESLLATPTMTLPEPPDGSPRPDAAPFQRLADVVVPVVTPAMERAYRVGEALARLSADRQSISVLVDLPGPEAVAFAAGACAVFEPVLLFDNWPHPHGVVPSHLTLAALAYYQPRFAEQAKSRRFAEPIFLLDRSRLSQYFEESDRFDNRYYARMPKLEALSRDGIKGLLYVVESGADLPEPDDLNGTLSVGVTAGLEVRALALSDFDDPNGTTASGPAYYGGSPETDASFHRNYPLGSAVGGGFVQKVAPSTTKDHPFLARSNAAATPPPKFGTVAVVMTGTGLLVAAALDRKGSMNRFAGGWGG